METKIDEAGPTEEEIQEVEGIRQLLKFAPFGLFLVDLSGKIVAANKRGAEHLGKQAEEIIGTTLREYFPQDVAENGRAKGIEVVKSRRPVTFEAQIGDKRYSISIFPVLDSQGETAHLAVYGLDITDSSVKEEALRESEARWSFALEGAGDGVWDWNAVTNEVFFSRQWKAMLGYEDHEIGNTLEEWDKRVHPEDKERVYEDIDRHFSGKTPSYVSEHRVRCKDGTYKWILDRGKVISRTPEGKPLRVIGTHTDISEQKEVEAELRKAHERLEMLLYSLPLGIVIIDAETHCIIDANPKACLMIGAPVDRLLGKECYGFVCKDEKGKCPVTDLGRRIDSSERILLTSDGREIPVLKTVLSVEMEGRRCLIECFSDISEIKDAELERIEKEKLQAVVETAGAVCHEMNQPLMAISGYSELLQMEVSGNEKLLPFARKIGEQVERMGEITRKLMRITSHRTKKYLDTKILDIDGASERSE
ncbi:MAG: PAS domain S-box protein [Deltaproteobacteria bacterium]|nr:PAS domain S-box protein [Deltaproteobacteria bacterium]